MMTSSPHLMLSRQPEDVALDEEVLHISNAPSLYLSSALSSALSSSNINTNINNHDLIHAGTPSKGSTSMIDTTEYDSGKTIDSKGSIASTDGSTYVYDSTSNEQNFNTDDRGSDVVTTKGSQIEDSEASLTRTDRQLVMLTQDIFYFEYGCVVFWGLSQR